MKIANDNNIKLFFVVAPSYNNLNSPDPAINRDLEKLLDGFPYFNYRNNNLIPELTENKSYWKDLVHFNKDGALTWLLLKINDRKT
jgi:muconolactone delta-isomerase